MLIVLLIILVFCSGSAEAETGAGMPVTFISSALDKNVERPYDERILVLALNASRAKYGAFELKRAPHMSRKRAVASLLRNKYPNAVRLLFPRFVDTTMGLHYIRFPVYLGALSHRVCFINSKYRLQFRSISAIEELKPYTFGMGTGWADAEVLRSNDLKVTFFQGYNTIFRMLAAERIDLFCRGIHEVKQESETFKYLPNIEVAPSFSISYPMIVTFFTHKNNVELIERLEYGFNRAFEQGKVQSLWQEEFGEAVKFVDFENRNHLLLDSELEDYVDFDYLQYFNHNIFPKKTQKFLERSVE